MEHWPPCRPEWDDTGGRSSTGIRLSVLPGGRENRRPFFPGLSQLLECHRLLRHYLEFFPAGRWYHSRRLLHFGLHPDSLPLPFTHGGISTSYPDAHRSLDRQLHPPLNGNAPSVPRTHLLFAPVLRVLRRHQPLLHISGHATKPDHSLIHRTSSVSFAHDR